MPHASSGLQVTAIPHVAERQAESSVCEKNSLCRRYCQKKIVFLQPEINRGTVQFRRPQFGDDLFGESQPIGFFFYALIAVMQY